MLNFNFYKSVVEKAMFRDREYLIKRDDLIDHDFNGNKGRKFLFLFGKYNLEEIISYGGTQSNKLIPLAKAAKLLNTKATFYTKEISQHLKRNPIGNYKRSLELGLNIVEIKNTLWDDFTKEIEQKIYPKNVQFITQGAKQKEAEVGIKLLAKEIEFYADKNNILDLKIFLPSGTGTTALFLQKNISFEVYTTPCVGNKNYLEEQFLTLETDKKYFPTILDLDKKYHFAKPYKEFFEIYNELKNSTNIEFELLYDPKGWMVLDKFANQIGKNILYIHQGGVNGNISMLERYKHIL